MYVTRRETEKKSCTVENFCCVFCCKRNGLKILLAKPCQALWGILSSSCVCKQIVVLCSMLQKSSRHKSNRCTELSQYNFRNSFFLIFLVEKYFLPQHHLTPVSNDNACSRLVSGFLQGYLLQPTIHMASCGILPEKQHALNVHQVCPLMWLVSVWE